MGKYHFIAIGGIGMSGLAKYLLEDGHIVSGSDINNSKYIKNLEVMGAKISIGHQAENIREDMTIIKSTAIKDSNPEVIKATQLNLPIFHRSDLLAKIANNAQKENKCFIGFSGTHGKTTTSGFASFILDKANLEPSFVVGGIIPEINTNAQHKNGTTFIAELDESDGTIIKYHPDILVINNLEEDHLDFYKNGMQDIIKTFKIAISNSKKIIINNDNIATKNLTDNAITFGLNNADYVAQNINYSKDNTTFDIYFKNKLLINIEIQLTGIHNIYNTLAIISALHQANIDIDLIKPYFKDFTGMGRRFQKVAEFNNIKVYDDYAHHPTEIKATLEAAASKFGAENIIAVFQPHRFTRLQALWQDFKEALSNIPNVVITDVYAASEDEIEGINSQIFANELKNCEHLTGTIEDVANKLLPKIKQGQIVIGLGAGTITNLGKELEKAACIVN